jgi:uncharacterized protein (TIGR03437 family)
MKAISRTALLVLGTVLGLIAQTTTPPHSTVRSAALFAAPFSPYGAGVGPKAMASGDVNGDGVADLVLLDQGTDDTNDTLTILLGVEDGALMPDPKGTISLGGRYYDVAVADFNGDGKLDIVTIGGYDIKVWLGDGTGGFSQAPTSPIDTLALNLYGAYRVGIGDFNRDGKIDLLIMTGTADSSVAILEGDGGGGFNLATSPVATGQEGSSLTVADFNQDGSLDVAITCPYGNEVIVLLGDGSGRLVQDPRGGTLPTTVLPLYIANGDFNGDGKVDLVVTHESTLTIFLGDGTGGFAAQPDISPSGAYSLHSPAVGDLDGDGKLDLAIPNADDPISNVFILLGDGTGGFEAAAISPLESPGGSIVAALEDFNNDGRLDLAVANDEANTVAVFLGAPSTNSQLALTAIPTPTVAVEFPLTYNLISSGYRAPTGTVTLQSGGTEIATESVSDSSVSFQLTFNTAGTQMVDAVYSGDATTVGFTTPVLSLSVAKGSQTITFPALPRHSYGDPPFTVTASASSGLPVTISVVSGPGTVVGNVVTLTGTGAVTLQASQPGNANYLPAASVEQQLQIASSLLQIDTVVNAASYSAGSFAPASYAVVFGAGLGNAAQSSAGLTSTLGGSSIQVVDALGKASSALLYYVSPAQMNFLMPSNLRPGMAKLTVLNQAGISSTTQITVSAVSPGIFSADATGTGLAAGSALRVSADGTQTELSIGNCNGTPLICTPIPIDLGGPTDAVYLSLYGTGIRGRSMLTDVSAAIGGVKSKVLYAGAQPNFQGLDQVNLQIDQSLRGRGAVPIVVSVDGVASNGVTIAIQ